MMRWGPLRNGSTKLAIALATGALAAGALCGPGVVPASGQQAAVQKAREAGTIWRATASATSGKTYLASVGPWSFAMQRVANVSVEQIPGAWLLGQITLNTNDPYYSCLNGKALNAWRVPSKPGLVIVHNGDQGAQCVYGTFVYRPFYAGTYGDKLVVLAWHANVSVEGLADASLAGRLTNFQTNDPYYACLDGSSTSSGATFNVWAAPKEFGSNEVAHNGEEGSQCVYGTFVF